MATAARRVAKAAAEPQSLALHVEDLTQYVLHLARSAASANLQLGSGARVDTHPLGQRFD
jgi:phage-related minor tail protein